MFDAVCSSLDVLQVMVPVCVPLDTTNPSKPVSLRLTVKVVLVLVRLVLWPTVPSLNRNTDEPD